MNIQPTETMLNLTRFVRIKFMHNYSLIIIHLKLWIVQCQNSRQNKLSFVEYNVTYNDKMNEANNNGR